jgi:RpiR family transcriptional regulator, carbohydrate utilization regulator
VITSNGRHNENVNHSYLLQEIRSVRESLSLSELRVADVILTQPYEFLQWSAADIALKSDTSGATVVRACRALGFSGLRDLRLTLARDLGYPDSARSDGDGEVGTSFVSQLFEDASRSLSSMVTGETAEDFARAVACLGQAHRILAMAAGPSHVLAQDFANSARVAGYPVECWSDAMMQMIVASQLGENDVCLAVSHTGVNALTIKAAEAAAAAGAKVVTVTGYRRSRLVDIATVALVANTFDFSTPNQATVNSAAMLLFLRGLVTSMGRREDSGPAAPSMHEVHEMFDPFIYRGPTLGVDPRSDDPR